MTADQLRNEYFVKCESAALRRQMPDRWIPMLVPGLLRMRGRVGYTFRACSFDPDLSLEIITERNEFEVRAGIEQFHGFGFLTTIWLINDGRASDIFPAGFWNMESRSGMEFVPTNAQCEMLSGYPCTRLPKITKSNWFGKKREVYQTVTKCNVPLLFEKLYNDLYMNGAFSRARMAYLAYRSNQSGDSRL